MHASGPLWIDSNPSQSELFFQIDSFEIFRSYKDSIALLKAEISQIKVVISWLYFLDYFHLGWTELIMIEQYIFDFA